MRNAEQLIGSSVDRMDKTVKRVGEGFGGISSNVQKALITLGALHVSLRTIESLATVADKGFKLWTSDIRDSREAVEEFLKAIEAIPELGIAFGAGRRLGQFFTGFSIAGFNEFFSRQADPILRDLDRFRNKFLLAIDKNSGRFAESEQRIGFATEIAGVIAVQGQAAERELSILKAINREEAIRLKFLFQREDLTDKLRGLAEIAVKLDRNLLIASVRNLMGFESLNLDLIGAREQAALRRITRRDPTESSVTALGIATFGPANGFNPQPPLDPPTKQKQEQQIQAIQRNTARIDNLADLLGEIGFR